MIDRSSFPPQVASRRRLQVIFTVRVRPAPTRPPQPEACIKTLNEMVRRPANARQLAEPVK
jgi:hypothetical protein